MQIYLRPARIRQLYSSSWLRSTANFAFWTLIFALAYTQAPLYTSNQNQYFLHGLADAGLGYLKQDWLANTLDPTPVFSLLAYLTYRYLRVEELFYGYYALQMGIYLYSLVGIVASVYDIHRSRARYLIYLALLLTAHSAALRFTLSRILGANWSYILEDGVADQRLLGSVFEPSTFSVLLVLSIYMFLRHRPYPAILCATLAATFHPTYLFSAAVLTLAYGWITLSENWSWESPDAGRGLRLSNSVSKAMMLGMTALISVSPILLYVYTNFANTPPETASQARQILVHFRIPHHALVSWWFDATAVVKILLVCVALFLVRKNRLFYILLVCFLAAAGLTVLQAALKSDALALIFPWRLSIFLVPLSTALIIAALVSGLTDRYRLLALRYENYLASAALTLILLVVVVGSVRFALDIARKANGEERPLQNYVAAHNYSGETYLTPVKMQDFRLATGSPVVVDFKSIPYRDVDVLEWYRRFQLADRFYNQTGCDLLPELTGEYGVTHVVLENEQFGAVCPQLQEIYRDANYGLYTMLSP